MKKKIILIIGLIVLLIILILGYYFLSLSKKSYTDKDFNIKTYVSSKDNDSDGIDDQTDILNNAKEYIKKKPKYKSKYYASGYPDDNYGVCTDVVAYSLLNSGYNLMDLVNWDIQEDYNSYHITTIDKKIDFRRVANLSIYFKNHAINLTTDINKIDEWQGGDIVVFKKHIGIVSDKRNSKGIPYLIHHANPFQLSYEEDILENRKDIIGHYRVS